MARPSVKGRLNMDVLLILAIVRVESRNSSVGIATVYGLDGLGSILGKAKRFFSAPQLSDRLWGPSNLISNAYLGLFPRG